MNINFPKKKIISIDLIQVLPLLLNSNPTYRQVVIPSNNNPDANAKPLIIDSTYNYHHLSPYSPSLIGQAAPTFSGNCNHLSCIEKFFIRLGYVTSTSDQFRLKLEKSILLIFLILITLTNHVLLNFILGIPLPPKRANLIIPCIDTINYSEQKLLPIILNLGAILYLPYKDKYKPFNLTNYEF